MWRYELIFVRRTVERQKKKNKLVEALKLLTTTPQVNVMPRPQYVFGTMSPYPTHKNVMAVSQNAFSRFANSSSWNLCEFFFCFFPFFRFKFKFIIFREWFFITRNHEYNFCPDFGFFFSFGQYYNFWIVFFFLFFDNIIEQYFSFSKQTFQI